MSRKSSCLLSALILVPIVVLVGNFTPLQFGKTCKLTPGYQANLNVQQPDGTYAYTFIVNANHDGKWAVLVTTEGSSNDQSKLYTEPLSDFRQSAKVSWKVSIKVGLLSRWDRNLYVSYKGGYCNVYSLSALYGR